MQFWGVEVKNGEPLEVEVGDNFILHLSQACLGELKKDKGNESACLYVRIGDKKFVIGILSPEKCPQTSFDLVFDQDFELSHNWKNGSVYFTGYKATNVEDDDNSESDLEMGDFPLAADFNNRKLESQAEKANVAKPDSKQVKIVEPSKDVKPDEEADDSSDNEDLSEDDGASDDEDDESNSDDDESAEEDDDSSDEDESDDDESDGKHKTPKKVELGKKRSAESATKTPVPVKKAKLVTPQKTDGKKVSGHIATPYPSKHAAKTPANSDQKKEQTQKSFACKLCNRSFGSENALQSHTKAKHSAA